MPAASCGEDKNSFVVLHGSESLDDLFYKLFAGASIVRKACVRSVCKQIRNAMLKTFMFHGLELGTPSGPFRGALLVGLVVGGKHKTSYCSDALSAEIACFASRTRASKSRSAAERL